MTENNYKEMNEKLVELMRTSASLLEHIKIDDLVELDRRLMYIKGIINKMTEINEYCKRDDNTNVDPFTLAMLMMANKSQKNDDIMAKIMQLSSDMPKDTLEILKKIKDL